MASLFDYLNSVGGTSFAKNGAKNLQRELNSSKKCY